MAHDVVTFFTRHHGIFSIIQTYQLLSARAHRQ